jgi:hypothetical protein
VSPQPKGEQEVVYGTPWGGVDYSRPYNALDPQFLAPGSINTSQINGFLTSSPWLASDPYGGIPFAVDEWVMGISPLLTVPFSTFTTVKSFTVIVTNKGVYYTTPATGGLPTVTPGSAVLLHTWLAGELNTPFICPGNTISFVEIAGVLYFTGLALKGIFIVDASSTFPPTFATATTYVAAAYLIELDGRLVAAECTFPGGGGTGVNALPTIAWSGPGLYAGSGASDPWNPVNNLGGGFNELSDTPDEITGLAGIGRSALILRLNGISQMDPNPGTSNSGLQPFTFYHLWASAQGVGAYRNTVAQFGAQVVFRSSDNIYSISIGAGLQGLGNRIINKINGDQRSLDNNGTLVNALDFTPGYWYFASIVNIAGQLHYLLTLSSVRVNSTYVATVYDCNLSETSAWHIWDLASTYFLQSGASLPLKGFSCPITSCAEIGNTGLVTKKIQLGFHFLLFGAFKRLGPQISPPLAYVTGGVVDQFVPFDYDFNSDPITAFAFPVYPPLAMPQSNIVFRAEIISLGHKVSTRRLRIQADNAPIPTNAGGGGGIA